MFIGIPVLLLCLPADFFDYGQSISLFELAGVEDYYSKGMTKGVMHLIHLDFEGAWHYNKLSFIVLPLLTYVWTQSFLKNLKRSRYYRQKAATLPPGSYQA
jgi:hypothetical protein